MLIKTQNEEIVNCDHIISYHILDNENKKEYAVIATGINNHYIILGKYTKKENAKSTLDMIWGNLLNGSKYFVLKKEDD